MYEMKNAYKILVGNPERKTPFRRPGRRWENNIRMDLREMGWKGVDWMHLAQKQYLKCDILLYIITFIIFWEQYIHMHFSQLACSFRYP
jgi:hypothetical protein